jgi:ribonuclease P protein component
MSEKASLPKELRLWRSREFQEVYRRGRKFKGPHFTFFCLPNSSRVSRLGLSVTKKKFRLSTQRHLVQRRLREAFRLNKGSIMPGHTIVLVAQRFDEKKVSLATLEKEFISLAKKADILKK